MKEFELSLVKMSAGNISLVDSIGSAQLAIQAAIRSHTSPEILNMFLKKENGSLRTRLASLDSDRILGRITLDAYTSQATDIIKMLEKLGEPLSPKEVEMLKKVIRCLVFIGLLKYSSFNICSRRTRNRWVVTLLPQVKSVRLCLHFHLLSYYFTYSLNC